MVEVDPAAPLIGPDGPITLLDAFEGRHQLIAYYFMWNPGRPAPAQCEGCTFYTSQVAELSYLHSRDITYAVFCQGRNVSSGFADAQKSYAESLRYRAFMGWQMPWYSAQPSLDALLGDREIGLFHLVCYLRHDHRVFETYWTKRRGVETMDYSYALMDLTVFGRQEAWEDSPAGRPQHCSNTRTDAGPPAWPPVSEWPVDARSRNGHELTPAAPTSSETLPTDSRPDRPPRPGCTQKVQRAPAMSEFCKRVRT